MFESHGTWTFDEVPGQFRFYSLKTDEALPFFIFWPDRLVLVRTMRQRSGQRRKGSIISAQWLYETITLAA